MARTARAGASSLDHPHQTSCSRPWPCHQSGGAGGLQADQASPSSGSGPSRSAPRCHRDSGRGQARDLGPKAGSGDALSAKQPNSQSRSGPSQRRLCLRTQSDEVRRAGLLEGRSQGRVRGKHHCAQPALSARESTAHPHLRVGKLSARLGL